MTNKKQNVAERTKKGGLNILLEMTCDIYFEDHPKASLLSWNRGDSFNCVLEVKPGETLKQALKNWNATKEILEDAYARSREGYHAWTNGEASVSFFVQLYIPRQYYQTGEDEEDEEDEEEIWLQWDVLFHADYNDFERKIDKENITLFSVDTLEKMEDIKF